MMVTATSTENNSYEMNREIVFFLTISQFSKATK